MQTLFLFSSALGIVGCFLTAISASQKTVCGRGYKFFIIFAQVMYGLSGIIRYIASCMKDVLSYIENGYFFRNFLHSWLVGIYTQLAKEFEAVF